MKKLIIFTLIVVIGGGMAIAQQREVRQGMGQKNPQAEMMERRKAEEKAYYEDADTAYYGVRYRMKYKYNKERNLIFEEDRVALVSPRVCLDMSYESIGENRWRKKDPSGQSGDWSLAYRLTPDFYFYWPETGKQVKAYRIISEDFKLSEGDCTNKWVVGNETRKIDKFTCRKATLKRGGRDWTAWFTTDMPHEGAPRDFNGLPGVVLELADSTGEVGWYFNGLVKNEDDDILYIKYPNKFLTVPAERFQKIVKLFALSDTANEVSHSGVMDKNKGFFPPKLLPSTGLDACDIDNPIELP